MKYQSLSLFKNHLKSAYPDHLSKLYLILSPDDYERRKAMEMVFTYLPDDEKRIVSGDFSLEEILDANSLFSSNLLALDFEPKKKDVEVLQAFLSRYTGCLLLGSKGKQHLAPIYRLIEKEGIILDLIDEKKWEKEKRLKEAVWEKVRQEKKSLSSDAAELLFASLPSDLAVLDSELEKLLTFCMEKKEIARKDVEAIFSASSTYTIWQIAEKIVWGEEGNISYDEHLGPMLFIALRSELRKGLIIKELLLQGKNADEIGKHISGVWPKALQKKIESARALSLSYFQKGLTALFEAELISRNGSSNIDALLDILTKKIYAYSST